MVIKGTKPDPKNFKIRKEKEWNRPHMETYTVSSDNESDQSERPTRSSSRASMYSDTSETSVRLEREKEAVQRQPGNTGYGRPKRAEKEALDRKRKIEEEIEAIVNPDFAIASSKMDKVRNEVAEKVEELRNSPTVDLVAKMTEAADLVLKAVVKSTNLQRTIRGELKTVHRILAAGATVLASRADKEIEGESGAELAMLRIELEMAREDIKRLRDKEATDRKMLEECRRKLEKMEDASSPRKKKGRSSTTSRREEEEKEDVIADVVMVEVGEDTPAPVDPQEILPPMEEWPPAMRSLIKEISKKIEDRVLSPERRMNLDRRTMERLNSRCQSGWRVGESRPSQRYPLPLNAWR